MNVGDLFIVSLTTHGTASLVMLYETDSDHINTQIIGSVYGGSIGVIIKEGKTRFFVLVNGKSCWINKHAIVLMN